MISATADGVKLPIKAAALIQDLQAYYSVLELTTLAPIQVGAEVVLQNKSEQRLRCIGYVFEDTQYKNKLVSEEQVEAFRLVTQPITGMMSVKDLLSKVGIKHFLQEDTLPSFWMLPSLNFKTLIKNLNKWAVPQNGGAPRFYLDIEGNIRYADLVSAYYQQPVDLLGVVKTDVTETEWMMIVPGNIQIYDFSTEGIKVSRVEMNKDMTWAKVCVNDSTGQATELVKTAFKNEYQYKWYSSRRIGVEEIQSLPNYLGQHVKVNGKVEGVVEAFSIPFPVNDESVRFNARIACQPS